MTSPTASSAALPTAAARVSFRQPLSTEGYVDAGWWPRSRDLTVELPALLEVLWTAARDITRISYHLGSWDPAPRKMMVEGRKVHLGGYRYQDPQTLVAVNARSSDRIEFLVVPPESDEGFAARALDLASTLDIVHTPADLLALAQR